jgi:L-lactate dehydrogenase (cytochrome)
MFYDYADSGSHGPRAPTAPTEDDFKGHQVPPARAVNMENRSTASTMVGQNVAMPVAIAPTGLTGMQHADGEILAAQRGQEIW